MKLFRLFIVSLVMVVGASMATTASAQFRFGVKAGVNISKLSFSKEALNDIVSADNQAGFTGGIMAEFTVPIIGVGADVSAMYVRRNAQYMAANGLETAQRDYIEIPVNLKWKISTPVASIITPYIFTGPSFAILANKDAIVGAYESQKIDTSWNIGAGVELIKRVQVSASYAIGMNKTIKSLTPLPTGEEVGARSNYWTVTAAWVF